MNIRKSFSRAPESRLVRRFPPYVFARVNAEKLEARRQGLDVVDLGMGNPDGMPSPHIIEKLKEVLKDRKAHGYSASKGIPAFLKAVSRWYERRFGVLLDPAREIIAAIGSKEGLSHLGLALFDRGDKVLAPDPTYPIHHSTVLIAGGTLQRFPLMNNEEKFMKNLDRAYRSGRKKPKALILSFPHNPTTTCMSREFFREIVAWAGKRGVWVIHDFAYADIAFDGYEPPSFLSVEGAKEIGVEFFSLSKSYDMAGWRVGFAAGNAKIIEALAKLKSYMDYGIFTPVQVAAIAALDSPPEIARERALRYQERRDVLVEGLNRMGWKVDKPKATMYVWAPLPDKFKHISALDFSVRLLRECAVAVSPGSGFGPRGEGFVRFALVENKDRIRQALRAIRKWLVGST